MQSAQLKILHLEDSDSDADLVSWELSRAQLLFDIKRVETKSDFLRELVAYNPNVILSDHTLSGYDGLSALKDARATRPETPFIFVSGTLGEDRAVDSLKQGAADYIVKGDLVRLPTAIERAIKEKNLRLEREEMEHKLRQSESLFKSLAEQAPISIVVCDARVNILFVNKEWGVIAGRDSDDLYTMDWNDVIHAEDRKLVADTYTKLLKDHKSTVIEYRMVRPTGEIRWVSNRMVGQHNAAGELSGFISITSDTTPQKLAEQKVARLSRIQAVLSSINSTIVRATDAEQLCNDACLIAANKGNFQIAWIHVVDAESGKVKTTIAAGNKMTSELYQRLPQPGQFLGTGPVSVKAYVSRRAHIINDIADMPISQTDIALMRKHGIESMVFLPLMQGESIFGILVLTAEVTDFFTADEMQLLNELTEDVAFALDHLAKSERLDYLAYFDSLTGIPNRTLFFDHLRQRIQDASRDKSQVVVIAANIERFRHINESFGEHFGDALLKAVALRMTEQVGNNGNLGRLGGDNFGATVPLPLTQDVTALAHELENYTRQWLETPFTVHGKEIIVPIKVGAAIYPDDGTDPETLYQKANAALKLTRQAGEHLLFYSEKINARVSDRLQLEMRLRKAVKEQCFVLYYQPKVDLKTNRVHSVEALIRWIDPERGVIAPAEFIYILEETGLIYEVGMWALQRAFDDHAALRTRLSKTPPTIAVNVSALQLRRKTFYEDIASVIDNATDEHHGIDIEITESLLMENIEDNIDKLRTINRSNVRIAVDDFGTGYSSLAYIAKLPIDILKIDRSFITKMNTSADDLAVVSAIITLAHSLDLRVVAEGVETEDQATMLRRLACDEAQGYLFCRPQPLEELIKRLAVEGSGVVLRT